MRQSGRTASRCTAASAWGLTCPTKGAGLKSFCSFIYLCVYVLISVVCMYLLIIYTFSSSFIYYSVGTETIYRTAKV